MNMYTEIRSTKQGFMREREGVGAVTHTCTAFVLFLLPSQNILSLDVIQLLWKDYATSAVLALVLDEIRGLYEM